jgi:predicted nucleotidyltransferase
MVVSCGRCHGYGLTRGYHQRVTSADVIEEIRIRLARAAPKDSRVVLFGSHARDQADNSSDYDVLVIEPEVEDAVKEAVRLRSELGDLLVPIDVVVIDRERAQRRASVRGTLVERALREGRILADT